MRALIGIKETITPWLGIASEEAIWHYALGVGDDNPLWWDPDYAVRTPAGRMFAPPTLLYAMATEVRKPGQPVSPSGVEELLPGVLGLWAGDRWVWHSRIWADERITATRELHAVRDRDSRSSARSVEQTELITFSGEGGRPVAELYSTTFRFERASHRQSGRHSAVPEAHYDDLQRREILEQYTREPTARRGATPRYWDDLSIGEELPLLLKGPLTVTNIVGWALAWGITLCPTNRMLYQWLGGHPGGLLHNPHTGVDDTVAASHWDDYFARESGMARGYDFGSQRIAWVAHALTDWCGDEGELVELEARLLTPNFLGDITWFSGQVVEKLETGRGAAVRCKVTGTNQRGEANTTATATVLVPRREQPRN